MWIALTLLILGALILSTITTLPFILIVLLCFSVVFKTRWIFVLAFFAGLYLDIIFVRILGQSSIFFIIFIFLLFLYERKFEIQSIPFVFFASFLGSAGYLFMVNSNYIFMQAVVSSIFAVLIFKFLIRFSNSADSEITAISKIFYF